MRLYQLADNCQSQTRTEKQFSLTLLQFRQANTRLTIGPVRGAYKGAPARRSYHLVFHGLPELIGMAVNGRKLPAFKSQNDALLAGEGTVWDEAGLLHVYIRSSAVWQRISVNALARF